MKNQYYIRKSEEFANDGTVLEEHYATTIANDGSEWVVDESTGDLVSPIGNISAANDEVVLAGISLEDMKNFMSSNKYNWR